MIENSSELKCLKFRVPKVVEVWISADQETRMQVISRAGYQEKRA